MIAPRWTHLALAAALLLLLALPAARTLLEGRLFTHMLVQLPALALAGALLTAELPSAWRRHLAAWDPAGLSCLLIGVFTVGFWLLPRSLDAALTDPQFEAAKFLSLPLLAGLPLALAWPRLTSLVRGFLWANAISMLGVMGWLYLVAPVRLCNSYLADEQLTLGAAMLWLAAGLALLPALRALFGHGGEEFDRPLCNIAQAAEQGTGEAR